MRRAPREPAAGDRWGGLIRLVKKVPYRIHTVLTDNGIQYTNRVTDRYAFMHLFKRVCRRYGIEHRRTRPSHPWTKWQVEAAALAAAMNRTLKEATVRRYHHERHATLREHLKAFVPAYIFAKRL